MAPRLCRGKNLLDLEPDVADVLRDGKEEAIALDQLPIGDLVRIRPGSRVPIDGEVVSGVSNVHESLVTGEPTPTEKRPETRP